MMTAIKKRKDTEENRAFWDFVEVTSKSVAEHFPAWKRGDTSIAVDKDFIARVTKFREEERGLIALYHSAKDKRREAVTEATKFKWLNEMSRRLRILHEYQEFDPTGYSRDHPYHD
jgi:hypothetical protein